jgi:hypothetical protein
MDALTGDHGSKVQLIAATHSPLVLASVESVFDPNDDAWFDLELDAPGVRLGRHPYVRHGEVGNWLVSEAFFFREPRSLEGEQAIVAARAVLASTDPSSVEIEAADRALRSAGLPDIDPFWVRWGYFMEQRRGPSKRPVAAPERKRGHKP